MRLTAIFRAAVALAAACVLMTSVAMAGDRPRPHHGDYHRAGWHAPSKPVHFGDRHGDKHWNNRHNHRHKHYRHTLRRLDRAPSAPPQHLRQKPAQRQRGFDTYSGGLDAWYDRGNGIYFRRSGRNSGPRVILSPKPASGPKIITVAPDGKGSHCDNAGAVCVIRP